MPNAQTIFDSAEQLRSTLRAEGMDLQKAAELRMEERKAMYDLLAGFQAVMGGAMLLPTWNAKRVELIGRVDR